MIEMFEAMDRNFEVVCCAFLGFAIFVVLSSWLMFGSPSNKRWERRIDEIQKGKNNDVE